MPGLRRARHQCVRPRAPICRWGSIWSSGRGTPRCTHVRRGRPSRLARTGLSRWLARRSGPDVWSGSATRSCIAPRRACCDRTSLGLRSVFLETVALLRTGGIALERPVRPGHPAQVAVSVSAGWDARGALRSVAGRRGAIVAGGPAHSLLSGAQWRDAAAGRGLRTVRGGRGHGVLRAAAERVYCQQFAQAFRREDFVRVFRVPQGVGPFEAPLEGEFADVTPINTPLV